MTTLGEQGQRELRTADALRGDRAALDHRLEEDGYLFFRGAVPLSAVTRLRAGVLAVLRGHGYVDDGDQGVWTGKDIAPFGTHPPELHERRLWQAFVADPGVNAFFEELFGEAVHWVPISQYRFTAPTPADADADPLAGRHQDGFYNEGIAFRTAWIPLVDVDEEVGGLALAPGWHRRGWLHDQSDPPLYPIPPDTIPAQAWRRSHYHPGDVVLFDRRTPHAGLPNHSNRLRLSIDVRATGMSGPLPVEGVVAAVGQSSVTLRLTGGDELTLTVDENTYIRVEKGRRIGLEELAVGTAALVAHEDGRATVVRRPT